MRIIWFFLVLILASCAEESPKKAELPSNILSAEVMVSILTDMHLANAGVKANPMHPDSAEMELQYYYRQIYSLNNTARAQFDSSMNYYKLHPSDLDSIYENVLNSLSRKLAEETKH